jgi:predicted DNA-binding transcriptional regulator AlpA
MAKSRVRSPKAATDDTSKFITIGEFLSVAHLSRRQLYRLRAARPDGFPREYEVGIGNSKHRRSPRFRLSDVLAWIETRALW